MAEDDLPRLRVVAERSAEEVEHERALQELRWPLIQFAANLLRVIRGAGRSYELKNQCFALSEALDDFGKRTGRWPSGYDLESILQEDDEPLDMDASAEHRIGIDRIVAGSLQLTASRLVHQPLQMRAGEREIVDGMRMIEAARGRMMAEWAAETSVKAKKAPADMHKPKKRVTKAKPVPNTR